MLKDEKLADNLKISLWKLMKNDIWVYAPTAFLLITIILYILLEYFGLSVSRRGHRHITDSSVLITMMYWSIPFLLAALFWRFTRMKTLLQTGVLVTGEIIDVVASEAFVHKATVEYHYQDQEYYHKKQVLFRDESKIAEGKEIELVIDPSKPKSAFIKDLFFVETKHRHTS